MNVLIALLMLTVQPKEPHIYYYNSNALVPLSTITMPNERHGMLEFLVHSPFELYGATLDSSIVQVCLPDLSMRKDLKLQGRWYVIWCDASLSTGSSRHEITLYLFRHKNFTKFFRIEIEGTERVEKPQGVR